MTMDPWLMKQIAELAERLPGVTVRRFRESSSYCGLDMFISDPVSLARLVGGAGVSNLVCGVLYADWLGEPNNFADPSLLVDRFEQNEEPHPAGTNSPMEVFGINLVHALYDCNL